MTKLIVNICSPNLFTSVLLWLRDCLLVLWFVIRLYNCVSCRSGNMYCRSLALIHKSLFWNVLYIFYRKLTLQYFWRCLLLLDRNGWCMAYKTLFGVSAPGTWISLTLIGPYDNKKAVLSQRWPRNATYGCPENFRDSLTTPTATIPNIFMGFCSD